MSTVQSVGASQSISTDPSGAADYVGVGDKTTDSIIGALLALFPDASPTALRGLVHQQLSRFAGARVTTFVPVLVVRACREALATDSLPRGPASVPLPSA